MKIAICGSMSFAKEMLEIQVGLEKLGHVAITPVDAEKYANGESLIDDKWTKIKNDVIKEWYKVIKDSDVVLVVNKTKNDIENYIGGRKSVV